MTISTTHPISPLSGEAYRQFCCALAGLLLEALAVRQARRQLLREAQDRAAWRSAAEVVDRAA